MQENNVIYEITRQIQDKDNIQKDIQQAFTLVSDMFKRKYIDKIEDEFKNKLQEMEKKPSKEITLLNAIKPFFEQDTHKNIDDTINMIRRFSVINSFASGFKSNKEKEQKEEFDVQIASNNKEKIIDESIKEDGIYDIDEGCIFGIKNTGDNHISQVLLILVLLLFMNKF